jgi:S-DNA-T family DNA segregation ATPase FtsK/SpoIIIE
MIDPKMVELNQYNGIPHLLIPVVTDPKKAAGALNWAVQEMTSRYNLFADKGVRDIDDYNLSAETPEERLPQMLVIIDELADLMMIAPTEVEDAVCRLAQMARAAGIHLVIATQRPSVDVITGLIKANIPSRIAFAVSSQVDSRTILDMGGAEKLLGRGDMLFYPVGANKPIRVQGSFVSPKEVVAVVNYIKQQHDSPDYSSDILEEIETEREFDGSEGYDELLPEAIEIVLDAGQASISMLQRRLRIGYARAARLIDEMEVRGIVSGFEGSKPRNVLITRDEFERLYKDDME